jgi:hypothetical protein
MTNICLLSRSPFWSKHEDNIHFIRSDKYSAIMIIILSFPNSKIAILLSTCSWCLWINYHHHASVFSEEKGLCSTWCLCSHGVFARSCGALFLIPLSLFVGSWTRGGKLPRTNRGGGRQLLKTYAASEAENRVWKAMASALRVAQERCAHFWGLVVVCLWGGYCPSRWSSCGRRARLPGGDQMLIPSLIHRANFFKES